MPVYIINNMSIHDPAGYKTYVKGFMPTLDAFGGKVLAVQDAPTPVEGQWPGGRVDLDILVDWQATLANGTTMSRPLRYRMTVGEGASAADPHGRVPESPSLRDDAAAGRLIARSS